MAKLAKSIIKIQGTLDNLVFVNSPSYGDHVRAARGTKKPAVLNDKMQTHANRASVISGFAKQVNDGLKLYSAGFRESMLWQAILKRLRLATAIGTTNMLQALTGLELNSRYPMRRFIANQDLIISTKNKLTEATLQLADSPTLPAGSNGYQLNLILLFFDETGKATSSSSASTEWLKKTRKDIKPFLFEAPGNSCYWLACVHLQAGKDGVAVDTLAMQAMRVIGTGKMEQ